MRGEILEKPLDELCDRDRGITYGIVKVGNFIPGGVRVIRGGDIRNGRIVFDNEKRVTTEVSQQFQRTILRGGEVVINLIAEPGHTAIVPNDLAGSNVSRDVAVIPLSDEVDHRYVDYCLKSPLAIRWLAARLQGSVTQKINLGTLRELPIPVPSLQTQRAIAHILGTLDDKIELNRHMNETLDATAQAIFRSWFVDFVPVRAKAEDRDPGLAEHIAKLLPDSFEDIELGEIPEGWTVEPLDQVAHFLNGLALQKYPPEGHGYLPAIKIAELRKGVTASSGRASTEIPSQYVVEDGDVLFSWSGSLEVQLWTGGRGALNQHLFKVTSKRYPKWFYYYWIKQHLPEFRAIAADKATTMGHIKRHHLTDTLAVVPPEPVLEAASAAIEPIVRKVLDNSLETHALAAMRDALLPRLISGELKVSEADRIVERHV